MSKKKNSTPECRWGCHCGSCTIERQKRAQKRCDDWERTRRKQQEDPDEAAKWQAVYKMREEQAKKRLPIDMAQPPAEVWTLMHWYQKRVIDKLPAGRDPVCCGIGIGGGEDPSPWEQHATRCFEDRFDDLDNLDQFP